MKYCTVKDCKNKYMAKGYCRRHYYSEMTPEYKSWINIRRRCYYYKNAIQYKDYMGRGIIMCDEWKNSFNSFYSCVGKKPTPQHSLDRINNNGNYEPGNVRWATKSEQSSNRRNRKTITFNNKTMSIKEWSDYIMVPSTTLWDRLYKSNWSIEKSITHGTSYHNIK